jgi:teichoic acid transport system permease protein
MTTSSPPLIELGRRMPVSAYVRSIWNRREFVWAVPLNELRAQNMDTVLGNLWHLFNPLMLVGVYWILFGVILDINVGDRFDNPELANVSYVAFLSVGIFLFQYSQKCTIQGAKSIVSNVGLIRSMQFPRAILPMSAVIQETVALVPALILMFVLVSAFGVPPKASWLLILPLVALQILFNLGAAFWVARFTTSFRDLQNVLPYIFRLLFYLSGVIFPAEHFLTEENGLEQYLVLFDINPLYAFVTAARDAILEGVFDPWRWLSMVLWAVGLLVTGFLYFRADEHRYGRG